VKAILNLWNAYADIYNACCDDWEEDTDAYREERAFKLLKAGLLHHELLNNISNRRHKSWYAQKIWAVATTRRKARWLRSEEKCRFGAQSCCGTSQRCVRPRRRK